MLYVSGSVVLPSEVRTMTSAKLYIWIEDISYVDGLARPVAKQVIDKILPDDIESGIVRFSLPIANTSTLNDLGLRVHLDMDGNGVVSVGDYVSTTRILVSSYKNTSAIKVSLQPVL